MDINWLEDFVCFARTLNFTKAASERNVTQSAYSRRVKSLELWIGTELIDRKTFPATLTHAGEEFLPRAKSMIKSLHRSRDEIRIKMGVSRDTIRFAAPHSISIHNLMPILYNLESVISNLKTRVTSDNLHNCYEQLSEQSCDFLMSYRFPEVPIILDEQRFEFVEIGTERLIPVYALKFLKDKKWQLPGWNHEPMPYLAYSSGSFLASVTDRHFGTKNPNLFIRHTDAFSEAIKNLCLQGAGIAWLPEASIKKELASKELIIAGDDEWHVDLTLAIYTEPASHSPQTKVAWEYFKKLVDGK